MYLTVDLSLVPPAVALHEPDDFTSLSVRIVPASHAWISPDVLQSLAGDRATDPAWVANLAAMTAYADDHGWLNPEGELRAHVETDAG